MTSRQTIQRKLSATGTGGAERCGRVSMNSETIVAVPLLPVSAPFNAQQRAWLNGYFAGLTSFADSERVGTPAVTAPARTKISLTIYLEARAAPQKDWRRNWPGILHHADSTPA